MKRQERVPVFYLLPLLALLSSCATVFNKPVQRVQVSTNAEQSHMVINDSSFDLSNQYISLDIKRGKEPLMVKLAAADSVYNLEIPAANSFNYLSYAVMTAGISCLIERKNPKRYQHRKHIYLDLKDEQLLIRRFAPVNKGSFALSLSIPYANVIRNRTSTGFNATAGFFGYSIGLDYFYADNRSFSVQAGSAIDFMVPFPAPIHYGGKYDQSRVRFINLRHNHILGSFDFGYGLHLSRFRFLQYDTDSPVLVQQDKKSRSLGLCLASYYRVSKNFRVGLLYQPGLLQAGNGFKTEYQHLLSIDLLFKFLFHKPR